MKYEDNQITAGDSCMEQIMDAFISQRRKRVFSDRQLEKKKKLNLSILIHKPTQSHRKITLSTSFHKESLPDLVQKDLQTCPNTLEKKDKTVSNPWRSSNFESKVYCARDSNVLSFSPQSKEGKTQKKRQVHFHPISETRVRKNHKICQKKPPVFFSEERYPIKQSLYIQKKDERLPFVSLFPPTSQRLQEEQISSSSERASEMVVEETSDSNRSSQKPLSFGKNAKFFETEEKKKKIEKLGEGTQTIVSKYDSSSKKSDSIRHSNVIWRLNDHGSENRSERCSQNIYGSPGKSQQLRKTDKIEGYRRKNQRGSIYSIVEEGICSHDLKILTQKSQIFEQPELQKSEMQTTNIEKLNYLGVGRFASVYLVKQQLTGMIMAMKEILKFTIQFNSLHHQLVREIEIQSKIKHHNVLSLYYAYANDRKYHILMEYGETSLYKILEKEGPLRQRTALRYLKQICQGLHEIHKAGAVHRDLKPENIILVNGMCKIGDFGWAEWIAENGSLDQMCGSPSYTSPQILNMQKYSKKTDCWSLGILGYELVAGLLSSKQMEMEVLRFDDCSFQGVAVSTEYKNLIQSLLQEQEQDRPSVSEILSQPIFLS